MRGVARRAGGSSDICNANIRTVHIAIQCVLSPLRPGGSGLCPNPPGHLKVNCPKGAREATLGCPLWGRQESFVYRGGHTRENCEEGQSPDAPQGGLSCPSGNSPSGNPFSFRSLRERAMPSIAEDTDCHVASLLAMTAVGESWAQHCSSPVTDSLFCCIRHQFLPPPVLPKVPGL